LRRLVDRHAPARPVRRWREHARALRHAFRHRRDQLVVLPPTPARDLAALGGERAGGIPFLGQDAAHHLARTGTAWHWAGAGPVSLRSRRPWPQARRAAAAAAAQPG